MSTVTWLWSVTGSGPQSVTWIAIRSRGRGHVIAIINWPGPQSGTWSSRFCLQSSVCQARPKDIIPGCPFRQVITIINITYINIGVCCSVINHIDVHDRVRYLCLFGFIRRAVRPTTRLICCTGYIIPSSKNNNLNVNEIIFSRHRRLLEQSMWQRRDLRGWSEFLFLWMSSRLQWYQLHARQVINYLYKHNIV